MTDESENISVEPSEKLYSSFLKQFHVPNSWKTDARFMGLFERSYATKNHAEALLFIEEQLKELGYAEGNQRMVHDYIHFMIIDLLTAAGIPFLTESEMSDESLIKLLDGKLPDLIIKSGPNRPRPLILDVFVGKSQKTMDEKKAKYSSMKVVFDFVALTLTNCNAELERVLEKADVSYLFKQLVLFQAEYSYWHACLKFKKILFNAPIRTLPSSRETFVAEVNDFKAALSRKAADLLENDGL